MEAKDLWRSVVLLPAQSTAVTCTNTAFLIQVVTRFLDAPSQSDVFPCCSTFPVKRSWFCTYQRHVFLPGFFSTGRSLQQSRRCRIGPKQWRSLTVQIPKQLQELSLIAQRFSDYSVFAPSTSQYFTVWQNNNTTLF